MQNMPNYSLPDAVFEQAANAFPTPFHLYCEKGIRERAKQLYKAFSWCEDFREYFAVKALPNPAVLKILKDEGCGVDCSSETELMLAEQCGFAGENILFSANAVPGKEFARARKLNALINLDDFSDIDLLMENGGLPECICIRYNPGGLFTLGNTIMGNPGEAKFGFAPEQVLPGLLKLREGGVSGFGLHAFLASNMLAEEYYPTLAGILLSLGKEMKLETGMDFRYVDLSGGIGIPYRPEDHTVDIYAVGDKIRHVYEDIVPEEKVAIKTELGRWMTGPEGWLVTRVIHEKKTHRDFLGVDACAANLIRPAMYGAYHHITVAGKRRLPCDHVYDVTGCLCENNDKFAVQRPLPETHPGDLLIIHDTGAHGSAMGYNYNGRLRCAEILYTEDGNFRMIRRAETPEDYFATLI